MASSAQEEISGDRKDPSLAKNQKFLVGVAVSVYQNSGASIAPYMPMESRVVSVVKQLVDREQAARDHARLVNQLHRN